MSNVPDTIEGVLSILNINTLILRLANLINRAVAFCPISNYLEWLQKTMNLGFYLNSHWHLVFQHYPFILLISEFHSMFILSWKLIISVEWVVGAVLQEFSKQRLYLKWSIYNSVEEKEFHSFEKILFWYDSWAWWQLQLSYVLATDMGICLKLLPVKLAEKWIYNNN